MPYIDITATYIELMAFRYASENSTARLTYGSGVHTYMLAVDEPQSVRLLLIYCVQIARRLHELTPVDAF